MKMLIYNSLQKKHNSLLQEQKELQEKIQSLEKLQIINTNNLIAIEKEIQEEINSLVNNELINEL